jgi:predicted RNase H-like nuclease
MVIGIIGTDCATQAKNIGLAFGFFEDGKSKIEEVTIGSNDIDLVSTIVEWTKRCESTLIALDAPLGWPMELGKALNMHEAGKPINIEPNQLFRRETDRFIKKMIGKQPLDVGADRIARTADAALRLLEQIRKRTGDPISLAWEPTQLKGIKAIEVYPAATLLAHNIRIQGYKQKDNDQARSTIIAKLREFIEIPIETSLIEQNDDALDAVVSVLAGLDFLNGNFYHPKDLDMAKKEGWIWVRIPR